MYINSLVHQYQMKYLILLLFHFSIPVNAQTFTVKSSKDKKEYAYTVNPDGNTVKLIKYKKYKNLKSLEPPAKVIYNGK